MAENTAPDEKSGKEQDSEKGAPMKNPTVNPGLEIARRITPFGCILLLAVFVLFMVFCLSSGKNRLPGYTAPHDTEYYSQSDERLTELKTELEANVFPKLGGVERCEVKDGKLEVTIPRANYNDLRAALLHVYDESLFTFVVGS
ncbi:MAG: hypothetical protein ACOX66_00035 [Oscillospiraceae bacterium]|jgi:hypothetical protein